MDLVDGILNADARSIARGLTVIERGGQRAQEILRGIFWKTGRALVVGVTGAPGSGKSTLVDKLAQNYRKQGKSVAVVAVDPTSPFTGGAILADRIRMQTLYNDEGVFIRSMATRGHLGGLAWATRDAVSVLDAAGKEIILVETVGVGQDEVEIVRLADVLLVILVPGMGDELQTLKAGVMEIADIFVINKADRPQVERFQEELESMLSLNVREEDRKPEVVKTIAIEGRGISEVMNAITSFNEFRLSKPELFGNRRWETEESVLDLLKERLLRRVLEQAGMQDKIQAAVQAIRARELDPYTAVEKIVEGIVSSAK